MSSIINKVKSALNDDKTDNQDRTGTYGTDAERRDHGQLGTGAHLNQPGQHDQGIPGSFPGSQHDQATSHIPSQHRDGREYVPPRGSAVQQSGVGSDQLGSHKHGHNQSAYDRSEQALTGRNQEGQAGAYGQQGHGIGQAIGSHDNREGRDVEDRKLMDPAAHSTGSNLMHPADGESGIVKPGGAFTGPTYAKDESSHHNKLHKHDDPRGHNTGVGQTHGHHDKHHGQEAGVAHGHNQHDKHHNKHHGTDSAHQGLSSEYGNNQSGVGGVGGVPYEQQKSQGREIGRAGTAYEQEQRLGQGHGGSHAGTGLAAGAVGAAGVGGLAHEADSERRHHQGASGYDNNSSRIGQVGQGGGLTSGAIPASARSNEDPSRYNDPIGQSGTGGVYNTVTGHGSGNDTVDRKALPTQSQFGSTPSNTLGGLPDRTGQPGTGLSGQGSHLSSATTQQPGSGYNSSQQQGGPLQGGHSGGLTGAGTGIGAGNTSGGSGFWGPGHENSKVMHECQKCGHDNDISHYFKKDAVYRIHQ